MPTARSGSPLRTIISGVVRRPPCSLSRCGPKAISMAHTVGLRPGDLFASLEPEAVVSQPDDVATEAAIARHGDVIGRDDLATALGWSPARLLDALEVLDRWLAGTGIRLRRTGWDRYTLEPSASALPGEHVRRLARLRGASTFLVAPDAARPGH